MADGIVGRGVVAGLLSAMLMAPAAAFADAVLDGTTGSSGSFSGDFEIPAAAGRQEGGNLFHSFARFSVLQGESATFTGPAGIDNVISRVTGGEVSTIDGPLASTIPGADFFFLNPAGVVFGPEASLDIDGSFHVSTADELRFADGTRFSASDPAASSFTIAAPEAFGFLGPGAEPIMIRGSELLGAAGETFSLVGGDINLTEDSGFFGFIGIAGTPPQRGNVTLVAMSRPGTVAVADGTPSASAAGTVLIEGSAVDVSSETEGGGAIRIFAGDVLVDGGAIASENGLNPDFSEVGPDNGSGPKSGGIRITASRVSVVNGGVILSNAFGGGDAGDIVLRVDELEVSDPAGPVFHGAGIRSDTAGAGRAGDISILGADRVLLSGNPNTVGRRVDEDTLATEISSDTVAAGGAAGNIRVDADVVIVRNNANLSSASQGQGDAGTMRVTADRIVLDTGGQITSGTIEVPGSTGRGGSVDVRATEEIVISGGGQISPVSMRPVPSGIFASAESSEAGAGPPGDVFVSAPVIRLLDQGEISSESNNLSSGGSVTVGFVTLLEIDGGEITTKASRADAGNITVLGPQGLIILEDDGEISTSVGPDALIEDNPTVEPGESAGNAGDISVSSASIVLNAGIIQANGVQGQGGNINITARDTLIRTADSVIEALSQLGIDGTVSIDAPAEDVLQSLDALPTDFLDASSLLREDCAARARGGDRGGSLVGEGGGGIAPTPDQPLPGYYSDMTARASSAVREARLGPVVPSCID